MKVLLLTICFIPIFLKSQDLFKISAGEQNVFKLVDKIEKTKISKFEEFEISNEITLIDYWIFVEYSSKMSGQNYLPDKTILPYLLLEELKNDSVFPAIGVSWKNAMEYCKWKTFQEQNSDSIEYLYRLPTLSEWLYAFTQCDSLPGLKGFNNSMAEWTLNSKDETFFMIDYIWEDYFYFSEKNDPMALQRKIVIGGSWLFKFDDFTKYMNLNFYETSYYPYIGFRIVKMPLRRSEKKNTINEVVLEYWK